MADFGVSSPTGDDTGMGDDDPFFDAYTGFGGEGPFFSLAAVGTGVANNAAQRTLQVGEAALRGAENVTTGIKERSLSTAHRTWEVGKATLRVGENVTSGAARGLKQGSSKLIDVSDPLLSVTNDAVMAMASKLAAQDEKQASRV